MQPYTYLIGWRKHDKWYYGYRCRNEREPEEDLWKVYFTSSHAVKTFALENGTPDVIRIHKTFQSKHAAILYESRFLTKVGAKDSPRWFNKSNGFKKFYTGPKSEAHKLHLSQSRLADPDRFRKASNAGKISQASRRLTGAPNKGAKFSDESRKRMSEAHKGKSTASYKRSPKTAEAKANASAALKAYWAKKRLT